MQTSLLRIETHTSPPVTIQEAQAHLRSQLVQLRFPVINGGVIWNRPVAVVVRHLDGEEKIVPILDVTRIVMFTLSGLFFTTMLVRIFFRGKRT
jgi:hypothetical protein